MFSSRSVIALFMLFTTSLSDALQAGDVVPLFKGPLLTQATSGQVFDSSDYRGRVLYVDFWASWCGPCRVSLPSMNRLYAEFAEQGFEVVAINVDADRDEALDFLATRLVDYPVIHDARRGLPEEFGVKGMPTAFLIDREGRVRYVHEGFRPGDEAQLRKMIADLVGEVRS